MATLDVTASTDFSAVALSDITIIDFVTSGNATATFAATQFDNLAIQNDVAISGSSFTDRIVVNGGGVDASAWEFSAWSANADSIVFNGNGGVNSFVGSRRAETINANGGNDVIVSGHALQGDIFNGGRGNDTFRYLGFTSPVNDAIDGGAGANDKIELAGEGTTDFTLATIGRVEKLLYASGAASIGQFSSSAFGAGAIGIVAGSASSDTLWIFSDTSFDLAASVTFTSWTDGTDQVIVTGTADADTISGSLQNDIIESGGGQDVLSGRGGDDSVVLNASGLASVNGGAGFDTLNVFSDDIFVKSLQGTEISAVEALAFDARGTEDNIAVSLSGHQIGQGAGSIETIIGSARFDALIVFTDAENGFSVNLSTVAFDNWTAGLDSIFVTTSDAGDDTVVGGDLATRFNLSAGADSVTGGFADDQFIVNTALTAGFSLDGEGGTDTLLISSAFTGTLALNGGDVSDIEILDNESISALIYIDGGRIGSPGTILTVDGGGDTASTALLIQGSLADLTDVTFLDWDTSDAINFYGTGGGDVLIGSSEDDVFLGSQGADRFTGREGSDSVNYQGSSQGVTVSLAAGLGVGGKAAGDILIGIEHVTGSGSGDQLTGNDLANTLTGEAGDDVLNGRQGADTLIGNDGDDTFLFANTAFSPPGIGSDRIIDFTESAGNQDIIDLSAIDAMAGTAGNNSFSLVASFTGEGQIVAVQSDNFTLLQINTTGTSGAEMEIVLVGVTAATIAAGDFIL